MRCTRRVPQGPAAPRGAEQSDRAPARAGKRNARPPRREGHNALARGPKRHAMLDRPCRPRMEQ
eukprot:2974932-Lingulodinium_polyedra.AAC.1